MLVTMRVRRDVPNLRSQRVMSGVRLAFAAGKSRFGFRLVHFSVQGNHLHLIVESTDKRALSRGMQGLAIRLARQVNGAVGRKGSIFADRYHARALGSPRQVRNALAYVLLNRRRHARGVPLQFAEGNVDPCSSAALFDGWVSGFKPRVIDSVGARLGELVVKARSWLLGAGWRRHPRIDPREVPGPGW